jgi:hypothetical protein
MINGLREGPGVGSSGFPAWLATAAMLLVAVMVPWVAGERFWEAGYGPALTLVVTVGLALSSRPMTLEVYGALVAVGLLFGVGANLLDIEGWTVLAAGSTALVATAYVVGDRPLRAATVSLDGGADEGRTATRLSPSEERLSPEALREIIVEFELPIQKVYRGGREVHIPAWRLVVVAKRRYMLGDDAEQVTDRAVTGIGGERISVVDPWRVLPDLIRKLRGRSPLPKDDLYVIPGDVFQAARKGSHARREGQA